MTPNEKLTLSYIINELKPGHDTQYEEFELDDCPGVQLVAHCRMACELAEPIFAIFTLGRHSNQIFLTITNGDPDQLINVFAAVEAYDSFEQPLGFGQTMRIENKYLAENRRPALLFLRPDVHPFLENFPDCADVGERHLRFSFVVFLSEDEYAHKLSLGLDALLDKFIAEDKDLFAIAT